MSGPPPMQSPSGRTGVALVVALLLWAGAYWWLGERYRPAPPRPGSVPPTELSAERALAIVRTLAGPAGPAGPAGNTAAHPVASEANARVRQAIVAHLAWLGLQPTVEEDMACGALGVCSKVWNVLARLPGAAPGKSVLLMAHYDSVGAGPGAADDLAGVAAVLEIARVLKASPPLPRGVIFLLTDGEEAGLLGAEAFAARSPAFREVGAVVNLEARGTSGPSLLFETSGGNGWMIERFAGRAERPVTSSVFAAIYDALPNDTDLSVFKRRGVPGLNFAFVGDPLRYHSPRDRVENLSAASLQHQGDGALAAVRALAAPAMDRPPAGRRTFFDLAAWRVVHWPEPWTLPLAVVASGLVAVAAIAGRRRAGAGWGGVGLGLVLALGAALICGAAGFGLQALLQSVVPTPWLADPAAAKVAFWALALAVTLGAGLAARGGSGPAAASLWAGVWLAWALLGVLLAGLLPAAAYLFVVPSLCAGLLGTAAFVAGGRSVVALTLAAVLPGLVAAVLWLPILAILYDGLGVLGLLATAVLLALLGASLLPLAAAAPKRVTGGLALLASAAVVGGFLVTYLGHSYTEDAPRPFTLAFHQDADSGQARWLVASGPPIPVPVRAAGGLGAAPVPPYPWSHPQARVFAGPAPALGVPAPELVVVADAVAGGRRRLKLRLTSPRQAREGVLVIPAAARVERIAVAGREAPPPAFAGGPWRMLTVVGVPVQGVELDVVLGETKPLEWYVADLSLGLPQSGAALLAARPSWAVPVHLGDTSLVSRKVKI